MKEVFKNPEQSEKIDFATVSAFTRDGLGGNEAGVVTDASGLTSAEMLYIAGQIGFSETAFVMKSDKATHKVDFYSPQRKIPLCGHATIAAWGMLFHQGQIKEGEHAQELEDGILGVTIFSDGKVVMDQPTPTFGKKFSAEELSKLLNIPINLIAETGLNPQLVNTGLNDLLIPIVSREKLFEIEFNDKVVTTFQNQHDLDSLHFFTLDPISPKAIANSRNTDPRDAIHEESATGSAHGALASYLFVNKKISAKRAKPGLVFEQGDSMQKPSRLDVMLDCDENQNITRVRVGGYATLHS